MDVVRTTKILMQVKGGTRKYPVVMVTGYLCKDGRTRIPESSYRELTASVPRGNCMSIY